MLTKYTIEYSLQLRRHSQPQHSFYYTDDPLICEEFVSTLLAEGKGIHAIRYDGAELPRAEFDRIIKVAAASLAADMICTSLGIKAEEERYRFGFSA